MKAKDLEVLAELRKDSRQSLTEISMGTGMRLSTVFKRINRVGNSCVGRYVSLIDFGEAGYNVRAIFLIRAKDRKEARTFLCSEDGLNNLYRVSGKADYLADMVFQSNLDCEDFTDRLSVQDSVESFAKSFVLEPVMVEEISFLKKGPAGVMPTS